MVWETVIPAAASVIGGALAGGGGSEKIHPMEYVPEFLRQDYMDVAGGINNLVNPEYYGGDLVADQNQWLMDALSGAGGYGMPGGAGYDASNALYSAGYGALPAVQGGMDYLSSMAGRGPNTFEYDQGTYDQVMSNLTGGMQTAFDLGARDIQRGFDWDVLPGLNMENAMRGGQGSTKKYQAGALGQALADENIMKFGSGLWTNAANQANQAGYGAGIANLNTANAFDSGVLDAYGNYGRLGSDMISGGFDLGAKSLGMGLDAGKFQLGYDQSEIDALIKKHNFEQQAPWIATQTKMGMMPGPGNPVAGVPGLTAWEGALQAGLPWIDDVISAGTDAGWWGSEQTGTVS